MIRARRTRIFATLEALTIDGVAVARNVGFAEPDRAVLLPGAGRDAPGVSEVLRLARG